MRGVLFSLVLIVFALTSYADTKYSWSQFNGDVLSFRVITDSKSCPNIVVNGHKKQMRLRHSPTPTFPISTCEIDLDKTDDAIFEGSKVPTVTDPQNILLIGDTGCGSSRVKTVHDRGYQDCSKDWHFPEIIKSAIKLSPDLIIHTGDFYYVHNQCNRGLSTCGKHGHLGYDGWVQEFFEPMKEALKVAPLIFVKGNHESCNRGWEGWNKFLSSQQVISECSNVLEPFEITLFKELSLLKVDSSSMPDIFIDEKIVQIYRPYIKDALKAFSDKKGSRKIFLTHRPLYDIGYSVNDLKTHKFYNLSLFEAMKSLDISFIHAMIYGHNHHFALSVFSEESKIPAQISVGNGGNYIWVDASAGFVGGPMPLLHVLYQKHGFAMMNVANHVLDYFSADGSQVGRNYLN